MNRNLSRDGHPIWSLRHQSLDPHCDKKCLQILIHPDYSRASRAGPVAAGLGCRCLKTFHLSSEVAVHCD